MNIPRCLLFLLMACTVQGSAQVTYRRILRADEEPASWLTYSGNYQAHRFSRLKQINRQNVSMLKPVWVYQLRRPGLIETSPIVADGVMYIAEPPSSVTALDVRTGRPLWTWSPSMASDVLAIGMYQTNRGVAVLDDKVYICTLDAHLVALDAVSGTVRWDVVVADNRLGYAMTAAPLAIDGKIIVGIGGAEAGIRGFLDAYDAENGKRLWRLHTIPAPGEPGSETWGGDAWKTGGGSTWVTGSYDPELNLIYWGTGNPAPDYNGDMRPGDNLYTCALIAVDADTGKMKWHFQYTPHDTHDWDSCQIPVLFDALIDGRLRRLVAMPNRNAFFYLLDRETGEFLLGTPYVKQTWAEGLDAKGRPIVRPGSEPSIEGTLVYPSISGGTNFMSPSYSPETKLLYVTVRELGAYYFKQEAEYKEGSWFVGGGQRAISGDDAYGAIRALDSLTGKMKWEFRLHAPAWTGVLSTAGGLVFGGTDEGNAFALDAETGRGLWDFQMGADMRAPPISFEIDGKQYVANSAGSAFFVFGLPE